MSPADYPKSNEDGQHQRQGCGQNGDPDLMWHSNSAEQDKSTTDDEENDGEGVKQVFDNDRREAECQRHVRSGSVGLCRFAEHWSRECQVRNRIADETQLKQLQ